MKSSIALVAIAGFAAAATAQTGSLSIVASASTVDSTTTTSLTLAVFGDADFGTAIGGGGFTLSAAGGAGVVTGMSATLPVWGQLGQGGTGDGGNGNYDLVFGQLIFPPFLPADPASMLGSGPVLLANFQVSIAANSSGLIDWTTAGGVGDFVLAIFTDDGGSGTFTNLTAAQITFGGASVNVVPAPSALALLGLGGLVAGRRRR